MKTLVLASSLLLLVACTTRSAPKEVGREAAPATTAPVTSEPVATAPSASAAPAASASAGVKCGAATCAPGMVCCNARWGICTPPDGACIQMVCEPKADAAAPRRPSVPLEAACSTDADCRLHASYCPDTPCACLALGTAEGGRACTKPAVNCLVYPCMKKVARCQAGACVVASE